MGKRMAISGILNKAVQSNTLQIPTKIVYGSSVQYAEEEVLDVLKTFTHALVGSENYKSMHLEYAIEEWFNQNKK